MRRKRHTFNLTINSIEYHRNGIAGEGFHMVQFDLRGSWLRTPQALTAVVFETSRYCAVIDPTDPNNKWRGDQFESQLREAIEEYNDSLAYDESTNPSNGWRAPDESIFPIRQGLRRTR
jgi:hypothetical protein